MSAPFTGRSHQVFRLLAVVLAVALPRTAQAAACCLSASVFGVGRLVVWEDAAVGISTTYDRGTGRWDSDGRWHARLLDSREDELRVEGWGLLRLAEEWQVFARAPWVVGLRAAPDGTVSTGQGPGDAQAGVRWELLSVGEYVELPGVALIASVVGPTGRRPEEATDSLGASATGRGAWVLGLAASVERTSLPWFVRLDVGATLPLAFTRADTHVRQRYGPGLQVAGAAGREVVADTLVIALQGALEVEGALRVGGQRIPGTQVVGLSAVASASWKLSPHWTLSANVGTDALGRLGLARNKPERFSGGLGVRHGFF